MRSPRNVGLNKIGIVVQLNSAVSSEKVLTAPDTGHGAAQIPATFERLRSLDLTSRSFDRSFELNTAELPGTGQRRRALG